MLKIKDNVDLKELEKFGFENYRLDNEKNIYIIEKEDYSIIVPDFENYATGSIFNDKWTKNLYELLESYFARDNTPARVVDIAPKYYEWYIDINGLNIIFDLIQAGLVEKIGE